MPLVLLRETRLSRESEIRRVSVWAAYATLDSRLQKGQSANGYRLSLLIIPSSFAVKDLRHLLCVRRLARKADFDGERGRENGVWPKKLGPTITAFCFTRYGRPEFLFSADATP
jgi:hypothetical protein